MDDKFNSPEKRRSEIDLTEFDLSQFKEYFAQEDAEREAAQKERAEREDDARDAGERHDGARNDGHHSDEEEEVHDEGEVSNDAEPPVVNRHEDEDERAGEDAEGRDLGRARRLGRHPLRERVLERGDDHRTHDLLQERRKVLLTN